MIDPSTISSNLWYNLCHRFESKEKANLKSERYTTNKPKTINTNQTVDNDNNNNIGIIAQLMNSGLRNSFQITASTQFDYSCSPQNLITSNEKTYFSSKNVKNSWVKFDFQNKKVRLNSYTITSGPYSTGLYHPKSWVIEGSNDDFSYDDFSFDINNSDGNYYRFIRLRQTGKTSSNDNYLVLSHIDFYGLINDS